MPTLTPKPPISKPDPVAAGPLPTAQPQSPKAAATAAGLFLATSDLWSQAYWNQDDLHCKERELFG